MPTGYLTDHSGTIAVANTSQQVVAGNPNRGYLLIQNHSTGELWVNFGAAATAGQPSIKLPADTALVFETGFIPANSVHIRGATVGAAFTCKQG